MAVRRDGDQALLPAAAVQEHGEAGARHHGKIRTGKNPPHGLVESLVKCPWH